MKTNIKLIQLLINSDRIRHYAVFLKLKRVHINGRVYNYTEYKLAKQSGVSISTIRKYMRFFKDNNWIRSEGKDIIFISNDKLKKLYGIKLKHNIHVRNNRNITKIVNNLRYEIFKHKQNQFNYTKQLRKDQDNPTGKFALKRYKAAIKKKLSFTGEFSEHLKVSVKNLALDINKSPSTVSRLIKDKKAKVFKGKRLPIRFKPRTTLPSNMYWSKGFVVRCECNSYIF